MPFKTGLSHTTIAVILKGERISVDSIAKLAEAFSGNGVRQKRALEDELLIMAGYRTPRPDEEAENNQPMAQLMDAISGFNRSHLTIMAAFAAFVRQTTVKCVEEEIKGGERFQDLTRQSLAQLDLLTTTKEVY